MKTSIFFFALLLGVLPQIFAQDAVTPELTAEEIGEQYLEAIGGAEAWEAVENMRMTAMTDMFGQKFPTVITSAGINQFRIDVDIQGQKMIQSFDGEVGWMLSPMMGVVVPTEMPEADAKAFSQNEQLPPFINAEERGYEFELVDGKEIEGVQTQGVRVTKGEDIDMIYYFDLENFVPIMTSSTMKAGMMA
ncbi:MAG: hypothetical protein AAFU03_03970, partial [Bacteroidota bacterium]